MANSKPKNYAYNNKKPSKTNKQLVAMWKDQVPPKKLAHAIELAIFRILF